MRAGLEGMAITITGAASGVGAAIARLAAEAGVGGLLLTDRNAAGLAEVAAGLNCAVATHVADLTDPAAPPQIIAATQAAYGRVDGLVNAAAITGRNRLISATMEDWDLYMTINARAPFFLMQGAVWDMRARHAPGSIVNFLSVNVHCGLPELSIYTASKAALGGLTRNTANAHLRDLIRVNGINLGWTLTPSEHRLQTEELGQPQDWAERLRETRPLGRLLVPEEAARLAVYLLSPASAPLTGVAIDLDQGVLGGPA